MHKAWNISRAHLSRRCGAKTRSGKPCQSPAVSGKARCRMHGGKSPGAPVGRANGRYRHGIYTKACQDDLRRIREIVREFNES
ncbi:HGGxSTG domain-containing protein [Asticcacaulis sp. AC402]|uniref:HGGxSTG domain-containing protein n=1 Tax=Asticcacaulis sp. AC402 TaxID=1282361 RepID=UPI0009E63F64